MGIRTERDVDDGPHPVADGQIGSIERRRQVVGKHERQVGPGPDRVDRGGRRRDDRLAAVWCLDVHDELEPRRPAIGGARPDDSHRQARAWLHGRRRIDRERRAFGCRPGIVHGPGADGEHARTEQVRMLLERDKGGDPLIAPHRDVPASFDRPGHERAPGMPRGRSEPGRGDGERHLDRLAGNELRGQDDVGEGQLFE